MAAASQSLCLLSSPWAAVSAASALLSPLPKDQLTPLCLLCHTL